MPRGRLIPEDEKCIQYNYLHLMQNLEALDIVDYLYQHEVITLEDKEKIHKSGSTRIERNEILLTTLLNAGPGEAFNYFLKSLEPQYSSVLEHMKRKAKDVGTLQSLQQENKVLKTELADTKVTLECLHQELNSIKDKIAQDQEKIKSLEEENKLYRDLTAHCQCKETIAKNDNNKISVTNLSREEFLMWNKGVWETVAGNHDIMVLNVCENSDEHMSRCLKNDQHHKFVPAKTFNINNLPEGYREGNLFNLIKKIAEVTVMVEVSMTSLSRPEFLAGSKLNFPFSSIRGSKTKRNGSGFVSEVNKLNTTPAQTCQCCRCKHSSKPSKDSWAIKVKTNEQLVYDQTEAAHTSIRLFYDSADSESVTLNSGTKFNKNTVIFETCDANICYQLEKTLMERKELEQKVQIKYKEQIENSNVLDQFVFIVSHPHGSSKKVSIGKLTSKRTLASSCTRIFYTAMTCPGSCGAPVYFFSSMELNIHDGSTDDGLTYSEAFIEYNWGPRS